jgi:hypothetical protein
MNPSLTVTDLHAEIDDLNVRLEDAHNRLDTANGQVEDLKAIAMAALAELEAIRGLLPPPSALPGETVTEEARTPLPIWTASEALVKLRVRLSMTADPVSIVNGDISEQPPYRIDGIRRRATH